MGAEVLALFLSLKERPKRIRVKNHTDWPDYVPDRTCHMTFDEKEYRYRCSNCSCLNGMVKITDDKYYSPAYCSECGARVIANE